MASVRDIVDDWTFICLDADLNSLPEDRLIAFKEKLHNKLRSVSFSDACLPEHFALYVKNNGQIVSEQNSLPDSVWDFNTAKRTSEKLLKAAISLAKKEKINLLAEIYISATNYGRPIEFWFEGASVFGKKSLSNAMAWNEDDTLYDRPGGNPIEIFDIQEKLFDDLSDNFDGYPWETDEDGDLTPNGEKAQGKLFALFVKNFFPLLWETEYAKQDVFTQYLN